MSIYLLLSPPIPLSLRLPPSSLPHFIPAAASQWSLLRCKSDPLLPAFKYSLGFPSTWVIPGHPSLCPLHPSRCISCHFLPSSSSWNSFFPQKSLAFFLSRCCFCEACLTYTQLHLLCPDQTNFYSSVKSQLKPSPTSCVLCPLVTMSSHLPAQVPKHLCRYQIVILHCPCCWSNHPTRSLADGDRHYNYEVPL